MNGNKTKDSNYVAGFLDKYVNGSNDNVNGSNTSRHKDNKILTQESVDDNETAFDAPIPFPPSLSSHMESSEEQVNSNLNSKGSSSSLQNFATAISNTFNFSGAGKNGNEVEHLCGDELKPAEDW